MPGRRSRDSSIDAIRLGIDEELVAVPSACLVISA
jgi:hypothetical protein